MTHRTLVDSLDHGHQSPCTREIEHLLRSGRRNVDEGALVDQLGVHHALLREVLDDHVDKFDLIGRHRRVR